MELYVARDKVGWLGLYRSKPVFEDGNGGGDWVGNFMGFVSTNKKGILPEVTFENSPQKVELKLINGKKG